MPWPMVSLGLALILLLWPAESRAAETKVDDGNSVDELRKELSELRARVLELLETSSELGGNEQPDKRAMLPYSGGIYGKRAAAMLPYSGGIYGKRAVLAAAEPYFLSRPSRAVPFNGGMYG